MIDFVQKEIEDLQGIHPYLSFEKKGESYIVTGKFGFKTNIKNADIQGIYDIEMLFTENYHQNLPVVKEVGGKIKLDASNHINDDGTCCLGYPHSIKMKLGKHFRLVDFFQEIVVQYFAQYSYKEKCGKWPFGETAHYAEGIFEYYMESYGLKDCSAVIKFLEALVNYKIRPKGYSRCDCGCNKLIKNCSKQKAIKKAYINGYNFVSELNAAKKYMEEIYVRNEN